MAGSKRVREGGSAVESDAKKESSSADERLRKLYMRALRRTKVMFAANRTQKLPEDSRSKTLKTEVKRISDYGPVVNQPAQIIQGASKGATDAAMGMLAAGEAGAQLMLEGPEGKTIAPGIVDPEISSEQRQDARARVARAFADPESEEAQSAPAKRDYALVPVGRKQGVNALALKSGKKIKPEWHAPWKMMRNISGHQGWVRALEVEPGNEWFASGASDGTIKIWDLASGTLKLTLTGHISCVRGIQISARSPYMFTVSEDKTVKCWDLEYNKVVRHYHGHLSGVYTCALHPALDVLVSGGRDCAVRLWDIRTESQIHCMTGHNETVVDVKCQAAEPQIISGSMDSTIKLWDLVAGKSRSTLTNHKKAVRALALHPRDYTMVSAGADNLKQWKFPEGKFIQNLTGHNTIINSLACNHSNVLFSGGDDGSMRFWDWRTGHCFQEMDTIAQPGSLESEAGVFASIFDKTGSRLITGECDKSIKMWKEDEEATPESHPVEYRPELNPRKH